MPQSAFFKRGGVVDAIAGHADDVTAFLQDVDDVELVLGEDLGEAIGLLDRLRQLVGSWRFASLKPLASRMFVPMPSFLAVS